MERAREGSMRIMDKWTKIGWRWTNVFFWHMSHDRLTQDHVPTLELVSKKLKVCLVNVVESLDICIWYILEIKLGDLCGCEVVSVIGIPEVFPVVLVPTVGLDKVAPTLQIQKSSLLILQMLQFYHIVVLNRALQSVPGIHCRIFSDLPKMV